MSVSFEERGHWGHPPPENTGNVLPAVRWFPDPWGRSRSSDPSLFSPSLPTWRESRLSDCCPPPTRAQELLRREVPSEYSLVAHEWVPSSSLRFRAAGPLATRPQQSFPRLARPLPSAAGGSALVPCGPCGRT